MYYQTIDSHTSTYPNPISFKAGDQLLIGVSDSEYPSWVRVTTHNGNEGWAPEYYIEKLPNSEKGIAIKDYSAFELEVHFGELLFLLHEISGWSYVRNENSLVGWVPSKILMSVTKK
jgi:SH3-like domain-containing protein